MPAKEVTSSRIDSLLLNAFACAQDGMGLVDCSGRFLHVNPSFCRLTGYSETELRGHSIREITHRDDREDDREKMEKLIRGEISSYQREKRYLHKNGGVVWISVTAWAVRDESGNPICLSGQVQDLTERKAEEKKLSRQIARATLAAGNGHTISQSAKSDGILKVVSAIYNKQTRLEKIASETSGKRMPLTKREQEILRLLAKGKTSKQIAGALAISPRTVEVHRAALNLKIKRTGGYSSRQLTSSSGN